MPSPFDNLGASVFGTVSQVVGYPATWAPSAGGATVSARVLFKKPTNQERLGEVGYSPVEPSFEFLRADMPGFFEAVRSGYQETVTVDGTAYAVLAVEALHDGLTGLAKLELS